MSIGFMQMDWDEYKQISGGNNDSCFAQVNNKVNKLWLLTMNAAYKRRFRMFEVR